MTRSSAGPLIAAFAVGAALCAGARADSTFYGPIPYLSAQDSPFHDEILAGTDFLETFECNSVVAPGVAVTGGSVIGPSGVTDSVDADDGVIDGSGTGGHSILGDGAGIIFTFDQTVLGALPVEAGIVWTDGGFGCDVTFEAFGPGGVSLGSLTATAQGDNSFSGTTGEDIFYGVFDPGGIESIKISDSIGGLEADHLQYTFEIDHGITIFQENFECGLSKWSSVVP